MASEQTELEIRDNEDEARYEAEVGGGLAMIEYQLRGGTITFTHTEVPVEAEGQGVGGQLARFVLEDARRRGLRVIPRCPFVAAYIKRHPEYEELVAGHGR